MYRTIIVEDDPMVAAINTSYLGKIAQFRLDRQFSNGKEALSYLETHDADLAIVDYYMPEMDGLEFVRECRARG
ncbi:MAG: response regulator, partial [Lachnospiraceae bacterium]